MMRGKIVVQNVEVNVKVVNKEDYLSLTDMLKAKEGDFFVSSWFRNRNTIEFLGIWEKVHNPNFNCVEFDTIKSSAGLNSFRLSVQEWIERTNAIGFVSSAGRYGGTYAHSDIALEFGMWISPGFKIYLIKEFKRLKQEKQKQLAWDAKRELAKINYHIHTDAIKDNLILPKLTQAQKSFVYADEADLLNVVMFGKTAKEWRERNKTKVKKGDNLRDYASLHELLVLANLETHNAAFISEKLSQAERLDKLRGIAERELQVLRAHETKNILLLDDKNGK